MVDTRATGTPTADKRYIACKNADKLKNSYVVDLQVEMQSKPCCDANSHPVPGDAATNTIYTLLKEDNAGCGTVTGVDTNLAVEVVTSDTFAKFMASNEETMTAPNLGTQLFNFYKTTNVLMHLYARDRIVDKCTAGCSTSKEFSFTTSATPLFATMTSI